MKAEGLGGFKSIKEYVLFKLKRFEAMPKTFDTLFELMFSEKENVMFEKNDGYNIFSATYGEVRERAERLAAALKNRLDLAEPGSVVGLYLDNGEEWIEAFWAILICGFSPLLMNTRSSVAVLEDALKKLNAAAVISKDKDFSVTTLRLGELSPVEKETEYSFGSEFFVMSSGTSENVKLCSYSASSLYFVLKDSYSIILKCKAIEKHYGGKLKLLTFLPFYHVFGLIAVYFWFGFFSRTFVTLSDYDPQTILHTIKKHCVTHVFAVPLFWEKVYSEAMKTIDGLGEKTRKKFDKAMTVRRRLGYGAIGNLFSKLAFKSVRENLFGESVCFSITGGSSISPEALEFFNAIGYRLSNGYGMSETGITSVELSQNRSVIESCSVGSPLPSIKYRIDENGELQISGDSLADYVICGNDKIELKGGWYKTRDLARWDGERYYILGRSDDLIVSTSGENINPEICERALKIDGANEVCLVGSAGGAALVVSLPRYFGKARLEKLRKSAEKAIDSAKLSTEIKRIFFTFDSLLGDDVKLNRKKIRRLLDENLLSEVAFAEEASEEDALTKRVKAVFAAALDLSPVEISSTANFFYDCGGTSLDYFSLLIALREEFSLPFSDDESFDSVSSICDYISARL